MEKIDIAATGHDQEAIYDEEIAPLMSQIIGICKANKINFHSTFCLSKPAESEEDDDEVMYVSTHVPFDDEPACLRLMYFLAMSKSNLDDFFLSCVKDGRKHGHSSVFLTLFENLVYQANKTNE